jgi:radical SAM protein with 4Fe4S-binding SPASM domain
MILNHDDLLVKSFLDRTFFNAWKRENLSDKEKYGNFAKLEVQLNAKCDLECTYCYYAKYKDQIYPDDISNPKRVLDNFDILIKWLEKNELYPIIEPFSGEVFAQYAGFVLIEKILDFYIRNDLCQTHYVVVPTNMSFIFSKEKTKKVEYLINKAFDNGTYIYLSASVDGKYVDENRPFISGKVRDDKYYDDLFKFCSKYNYAFHPMMYSKNIHKWKQNYLWFQEMFEKHKMSWDSIYFLEVRNVEWTIKQIDDFYKFMRFLVNYYYIKVGNDPDKFMTNLRNSRLSNLFSMFGRVGRGSGCSVQNTIQLRLGDLTHSICHRASYKPHNLWKFEIENNEISGIKALNASLLTAWTSVDEDNFPYCQTCLIKHLCCGQCWGSMYETNSTTFTPIPTVCLLEHAKVKAMLDEIYDLGLHPYIYSFVCEEQKQSLKLYYEKYKGGF